MRCVYCGCSQNNACEGGCHWISIDPPVCSACEDVHAAAEVSIRETDPTRCPASPTPAAHALVWTSADRCHCVRCREEFAA